MSEQKTEDASLVLNQPVPAGSAACDKQDQDPLSSSMAQQEIDDVFKPADNYTLLANDEAAPAEPVVPAEQHQNPLGDPKFLVPYMVLERQKNEVAAIRYIQHHTIIPVPNIRCAFEDHDRYYVITDAVPGVRIADLPEEKKPQVIEELQGYIAQMYALKSKSIGGVLGDVILPYCLEIYFEPDPLILDDADEPIFVFCHDDLSQANILVDEKTLKINAILDWEYSGFFPVEFDRAFYLCKGPSDALNGEEDDKDILLEFIIGWKNT